MKSLRLGLVAAVAAGAALIAQPMAANAADWPTDTVTIIVPYSPGVTDKQARTLAGLLEDDLGVTVQVDNKPGGGGAIGAQFVASAEADGHTLLYASPAVISVATVMRELPYSYEDLKPIAQVTGNPHVLAVRADAPFKTIGELVKYAKDNPGGVNFGSSGAGTSVHLAGAAFADAAGIELNHVPYKGLSPAITAALGGHVDMVIGLPIAIVPQVEAGKLIAVAQFGGERSPVLADVPTLQESGVDLTLGVNLGLLAPKGIPADVVSKIEAAVKKAVESKAFGDFASQTQATPLFDDAAGYGAGVDAEHERFKVLIPKLGLGQS